MDQRKTEKRTHDLPRISLHPLTLDQALGRVLKAPVEPKQPASPKKKHPKG